MSKPIHLSVKEYAELIEKNERIVYKMIKDEMLVSIKEKGKYTICVDQNLLRVMARTQMALQEHKKKLMTLEAASKQTKKPFKRIKRS